jgi:hypothetical protein
MNSTFLSPRGFGSPSLPRTRFAVSASNRIGTVFMDEAFREIARD